MVDERIVVVRRVLPIPRDEVFAAWLDPESLARWMCPGAATSATAEVDPRVGGSFRIVMTDARGEVEHLGQYLKIEPPSMLSFTWISVNTDHEPTVVTIEFLIHEAGTELVLTHRGLPPSQVDAHRKGWTDIVGNLEGDSRRRKVVRFLQPKSEDSSLPPLFRSPGRLALARSGKMACIRKVSET